MKAWQIVRLLAGFFILTSVMRGYTQSPTFVSKYWLVFTAFVGVNLLQGGVTRWYLMESVLRKLGVRGGA